MAAVSNGVDAKVSVAIDNTEAERPHRRLALNDMVHASKLILGFACARSSYSECHFRFSRIVVGFEQKLNDGLANDGSDTADLGNQCVRIAEARGCRIINIGNGGAVKVAERVREPIHVAPKESTCTVSRKDGLEVGCYNTLVNHAEDTAHADAEDEVRKRCPCSGSASE